MSSTTNTNIIQDCSYGCNTRIYWNTAVNEYWEVFSHKVDAERDRNELRKTFTQSSKMIPDEQWRKA